MARPEGAGWLMPRLEVAGWAALSEGPWAAVEALGKPEGLGQAQGQTEGQESPENTGLWCQ